MDEGIKRGVKLVAAVARRMVTNDAGGDIERVQRLSPRRWRARRKVAAIVVFEVVAMAFDQDDALAREGFVGGEQAAGAEAVGSQSSGGVSRS